VIQTVAGVALDNLLPLDLPPGRYPGRVSPPVCGVEQARRLLQSGRLPRPRYHNPGALLNARHAEVPFHTWLRVPELAALRAWYASDDAVAVTVIHGPGGTGKTRLALELCEQLTAEGYLAGLVPTGVPTDVFDNLLTVEAKVLVVIDYAETRPGLGAWLNRVAMLTPPVGQQLRIVLVVRNLTDWWEALLERSSELRALLIRDRPIALCPDSVALAARNQVFTEAVDHFARSRGIAQFPAPTPTLQSPEFGNILYLHMSALATVEGRSTRCESLLEETRLRERGFWLTGLVNDESASRRYGRQIEQAVTAVILSGGASDRDNALELLERAGVEEPLRAALLIRLGDLYPGTGERHTKDAYLAPLAPDLLAEAQISAVLAHRETPAAFVSMLFARARPERLRPVLQWLGRLATSGSAPKHVSAAFNDLLAEDLPGRAPVALDVAMNLAEKSLSNQLGEVLGDALQARGTTQIAAQLLSVANIRSITLHRVRAWIYETAVAALPPLDPKPRFVAMIGLAGLKSEHGAFGEAKDLCLDALAVSREWARDDTSALWSSVLGLGLLGTVATETAERGEALAILREGISLCETVQRAAPGEHNDLELLLRMMYGHALLQVGAPLEAHTELAAADAGYADLVNGSLTPSASDHALCIFLLATSLKELGRYEAAASNFRRAVVLQRRLAAIRRGEHIVGLARNLSWLAAVEVRLGTFDAACADATESSLLWEEAHGADPNLALSGLAFTLSSLAGALHCRGEHVSAREHAERAVVLWRGFCESNPGFSEAMLAASLGTLGNILVDPADGKDSLAAFDEALTLLRPLADQYPLVFSPPIGRTLLLRGQRFVALRDSESALISLRAAVDLYSSLPDASAYTLEWGLALVLQIALLDRPRQLEEALACSASALEVLQCPQSERGLFHDLLYGAASVMRGQMFAELDVDDQARVAFQNSLEPLRRALVVRPDAADPLCGALYMLAEYLPEQCVERELALLEVVSLRRARLTSVNALEFELPDSLIELAMLYLQRDDATRAEAMLDEARPMLARLNEEAPDEHARSLIRWFATLAELDPNEDARAQYLLVLRSLFGRELGVEDALLPQRMNSLIDASTWFNERGQFGAATTAVLTVIVRCQEVIMQDRTDVLLVLARAHETSAHIFKSAQRRIDRVIALRNAILVRERLDARAPSLYRASLLACMAELAVALSNAWMGEEARRVRAAIKALRGPRRRR
jgi:tetratricopeptide (TPR) repeat protein